MVGSASLSHRLLPSRSLRRPARQQHWSNLELQRKAPCPRALSKAIVISRANNQGRPVSQLPRAIIWFREASDKPKNFKEISGEWGSQRGDLISPHISLGICKAVYMGSSGKVREGPSYLPVPGWPWVLAGAGAESRDRPGNCVVFEWAPHHTHGWEPSWLRIFKQNLRPAGRWLTMKLHSPSVNL